MILRKKVKSEKASWFRILAVIAPFFDKVPDSLPKSSSVVYSFLKILDPKILTFYRGAMAIATL